MLLTAFFLQENIKNKARVIELDQVIQVLCYSILHLYNYWLSDCLIIRLFGYSIIRLSDYSFIELITNSITQIFNYTIIRLQNYFVIRYSAIRIYEFLYNELFNYSIFAYLIFLFSNIRLCGCPIIQLFVFAIFRLSKYWVIHFFGGLYIYDYLVINFIQLTEPSIM